MFESPVRLLAVYPVDDGFSALVSETDIASDSDAGNLVKPSAASNYGLVSVVASNSQRAKTDASIGTPEILRISHEVKGQKLNEVARHLVRLDVTKAFTDSTGSPAKATMSVYTVFVVPTSGVFSTADVESTYKRLVFFLSTEDQGVLDEGAPEERLSFTASRAKLARILNGEP